jgi:hypothetical protein
MAVVHFFGGADLRPQPPVNAPSESVMTDSPVQQVCNISCTDNGAAASVLLAANDIIRLSQELTSKALHDPGIAKSLVSIRSQLSALVHSAMVTDGSPLPEKEIIGPNQRSWLEMAAQMGVKCSHNCGKGKVDSALTVQHIGEPNRKHAADNDPYGAGEQLLQADNLTIVRSLFQVNQPWLTTLRALMKSLLSTRELPLLWQS